MGIKYSFVDNAVYGIEDINDITKSIVGAGIAPFVSKDSYNVSDLNVLTSALVEAGTQLDGCKCSVENAGTTEMTVKVSQGVIFFESGVRMTVDEEGYTVSVTPNTAGYVFAHYNPSLQKADIVFDAELPTDGEYVNLAKISADGTISDKRDFARSKVGTLGENCAVSFTASSENNYRYSGDLSRFNYALLLGVYSSGYTYYGAFDISAGKMIYGLRAEGGAPPGWTGYSSPYYKGYIGTKMDNLTIQIIDGELYVSKEGVTVILV